MRNSSRVGLSICVIDIVTPVFVSRGSWNFWRDWPRVNSGRIQSQINTSIFRSCNRYRYKFLASESLSINNFFQILIILGKIFWSGNELARIVKFIYSIRRIRCWINFDTILVKVLQSNRRWSLFTSRYFRTKSRRIWSSRYRFECFICD